MALAQLAFQQINIAPCCICL